jgi:hypothetical protein
MHPEDKVEAWREDEARFGLQPVLRRVWSPKGERPIAMVAPDYEWCAHFRDRGYAVSTVGINEEQVRR